MSEQIPALPPPARTDGPSARPSKDGDAPPGGFAEVLGSAETAAQPTPGERTARTAHAEGTTAEGDSYGPKHPTSRRRTAEDAAQPAVIVTADPTLMAAPIRVAAIGPVAVSGAGPIVVDGKGAPHQPLVPLTRLTVPLATAEAATTTTTAAAANASVGAPPAAVPTGTDAAKPVVAGRLAAVLPGTADQPIQAQTAVAAESAAGDGVPKAASPVSKTGGQWPRPLHRGHRLSHAPITAQAMDEGRPLRRPASRLPAGGQHQTPAPAAPIAAPGSPSQAASAAMANRASPAAPAAKSVSQAPEVRVNDLAESMHALVKVANRRGTAAARITLRPAELGGIQVQLRSHAGGVSAALTAETQAGAQALGVSQGELRRSLEAQGIVVHTIDVHLAGDGLGADGRGERWQSLAQQMGAAAVNDDDSDTAETTIELSRLPDSGAQVDVLA